MPRMLPFFKATIQIPSEVTASPSSTGAAGNFTSHIA